MWFWIMSRGRDFQATPSATLKSVRFVRFGIGIWPSKKYHRFSIGFKSGDCGGHGSSLWIFCALRNSMVTLAVCFGSLSCWKMYSPLTPRLGALGSSPRFRMSMYCQRSILPSTSMRGPVPLVEKQLHSITKGGCLIVSWTIPFWRAWPSYLYTRSRWFDRISNLDSSLKITFSQKAKGSVIYFFANSSRFAACLGVSFGLRRA